ncbi:serine/threonine protein kinase [Arthrobacter sp. MYb227]|nr:serine/threonine protein kinase [Arthrobacter sp. MYb227]
MSTVYRASDTRLHRTVAVKVLHAHMASDPAVLERFTAEAIISAGLDHANIVKILDHHVSPDAAYLVMEYVRGLNLRQLLDERGRFTPRQTLAMLRAICTGLAVAHQEGIVHRDMKPANVLISDEASVKVADFGLARAASAHTNATSVFGTAAYISPELAVGDPADERSDIYAVGIMAYELLTGRQPFSSESVYGLAFKHINNPVPAPSELVPGLSPELDELVAYCTDKDPENRPQNASFLLSDIQQMLATLGKEQLDLGSETLGMVSDLVPAITSAHTTVHDRLAQAQQKRDALAESAADAMTETMEEQVRTLNPSAGGSAPVGTAPQKNPDATEVISASADTTIINSPSGNPDVDHTTVLHKGSDHTSVMPSGLGSRNSASSPSTGELAAVPSRRPMSARRARKNAKATEVAWRKNAQIPTHQLAPKMPARRKWLIGVLLSMLAALLAAVGFYFGMGPGAPFTVPQLTNVASAQAVSQLRDAGVEARTTEVFDEKIERGLVVGSEPAAGETIRRFQGLDLNVSKGPELFAVPNLNGRSQQDAEKDLKTAQLVVGKVTQKYSEEVAKDAVISHTPGPEEMVRRDSKISLVISKGPAPVDVPNIVGETVSDANAALETAGLKGSEDSKAYSRSIPAGAVISQKPAKGQAERGSTVGYVVSLGPKMIEVPNVQGKQLREARATLESLGFKVQVDEFLGGFFGTVRSQTPAGGTAAEGSTIKLVVV